MQLTSGDCSSIPVLTGKARIEEKQKIQKLWTQDVPGSTAVTTAATATSAQVGPSSAALPAGPSTGGAGQSQ